MKLGVNIDHIATLRNARGNIEPSVLEAGLICQNEGMADGITIHLREDRRHIKDIDIYKLKAHLNIPLNLEMAVNYEMLKIALDLKPHSCCLVPERREELTTEGGLDVISKQDYLKDFIKELNDEGIVVSLFVEPDLKHIEAAKEVNTQFIELHTGKFSNLFYNNDKSGLEYEITKLKQAAQLAQSFGIKVNAGHGLNYNNVHLMKDIPDLIELNIGHSIISRAIFVGLKNAVLEMKELIK